MVYEYDVDLHTGSMLLLCVFALSAPCCFVSALRGGLVRNRWAGFVKIACVRAEGLRVRSGSDFAVKFDIEFGASARARRKEEEGREGLLSRDRARACVRRVCFRVLGAYCTGDMMRRLNPLRPISRMRYSVCCWPFFAL